MELPYGLTLEEVKEIYEMWHTLYEEVENGTQPLDRYDADGCANFDDWHEDDGYIDRYLQIGDGEYCITTYKETNETYMSKFITISTDADPEHWCINQLKTLVG